MISEPEPEPASDSVELFSTVSLSFEAGVGRGTSIRFPLQVQVEKTVANVMGMLDTCVDSLVPKLGGEPGTKAKDESLGMRLG